MSFTRRHMAKNNAYGNPSALDARLTTTNIHVRDNSVGHNPGILPELLHRATFLAKHNESLLTQRFDQIGGGNNGQLRHRLNSDLEGGQKRGFSLMRAFIGSGRFQKEFYRLAKILLGFFNGFALNGNSQLRALGHIPVLFVLDDDGEGVGHESRVTRSFMPVKARLS